ncbi:MULTISPECIES: ABC transporter permease [Halocynthiibacter]|uniref:ABC transporter permease n=1 Tax=Halocynthiibacter halioticoli TaxID=2986804 RepID=A0AAE3LST4_9RHOB|nr:MULTISPECIES: ABC transporter permease [Halocynthiibacter]MCV6823931.1 ABC transporter permease [Halocynthiibacter halioticoli]MCW4056932.1 ABC transporter permease [Halocynthiibacter sp. SDUM655004]MDE0590050.1 ABC transporter permease [Halocynthiibacter sp. C4]
MRSIIPILTVVAAIFAIWFVGSFFMNKQWTLDQAERAGTTLSFSEVLADTMTQERPKLPTPIQVFDELWETTGAKVLDGKAMSKRSLIYHGWITLSSTLVGFVIGTLAGILLAVGIVHNKAMDMSVMPWAIASQTIPILAIAPMIVVVMNSIGVQGLLPKAIIAAYLSFFPVVVGMVKGLRSPNAMQLDLMKTYNAGQFETFWKLRLPSSMPFLFTSLKVGIAASLVGAIVAELSSSPLAGFGGRMLSGSYYGQTIQIWSALFAAAIVAACLVGIVGVIQQLTLKKMGMAQ